MSTPELTLPTVPRDEEALIGTLLVNPREVLPLIAPIVTGADFFDEVLGKAFTVIVTLADAGRPVDNLPWLAQELQKHGVPKTVIDKICVLQGQVPHWGHCTWHAEHVRDAHRLRKLCVLSTELRNRAYETGAEVADVQQWLESQLAKQEFNGAQESKSIREVVDEAIAEIEAAASATNKPGIFTGLPAVDELTGPFLGGELVVIGARTGVGKTVFATQAAIHSAERDRGGLIVSLEMKSTELIKRILCRRAGVDSRQLRAGKIDAEKRKRIRLEGDNIGALPLWLDAPACATLAQIRAQARYRASKNGIRFLVVDYLNLIKPAADERRMDRHLQVGAVTMGLKQLAKELDITVFALAQIGREGEDEPRLTHLRESGSIEQDADAVLLIHNFSKSKTPSTNPNAFDEAYCNVAKFRHGSTGAVRLKWYPHSMEFRCD